MRVNRKGKVIDVDIKGELPATLKGSGFTPNL